MDNIQEIINSIQEIEAKKRMNNIYEAMEAMSHKQPATGFHHRFYVPGWIGSIQCLIVSSKMDKWCKQPFYNEKNYYEFADWIGESAHLFHDYLQKPEVKCREDYDKHSNDIVTIIHMLLLMWVECSPEVASFTDRDYHDELTGQDYKVSIAYLLNKMVESEIGKPDRMQNEGSAKASGWQDFKEEAKSFGYMIAGYLINILIFALIAGIISAIF